MLFYKSVSSFHKTNQTLLSQDKQQKQKLFLNTEQTISCQNNTSLEKTKNMTKHWYMTV